MIAAVDKILSRIGDDVKVIPGHGPLSDKAGLRAFDDMMKGTSSAVENAIRAGKTADQMKQEKVLAAWEPWGKSFISTDRFIDTLYADLHGGAAVTSTQHH
jgi:glyoxylase-like metal-dependent hydrolase (beta-lactamase superfamily II)